MMWSGVELIVGRGAVVGECQCTCKCRVSESGRISDPLASTRTSTRV
jgi:hypothetical protein